MTHILFNTRILASLAIIVFAGAIVASSTGAFFSDTETSTGNTFTAGDIDLRIDNESYVTNAAGVLVASPANSWELANLTNQLFFSFEDVKPGDIGEDTISIHPGTNDAYACMAIDVTGTPENTLTDPETDSLDAGPANGDNGELQNYLRFTFWEDDGDNVFEVGETAMASLNNVLASSLQGQWHTIADSGNLPAIPGNGTAYVAKAWCFGTLTPAPVANDAATGPLVRGTGFTCSGVGNQNDSQTDGIVLDVSFQAVQARNNGQFSCTSLPPFVGEEPVDDVVVVNANNLNGWFIRNFDNEDSSDDDTTTDSGTDGNFENGPGTPPLGTGSFEQKTGTDGNDGQRLMTNLFNGMPLSNMLDMQYSSYVTANGGAQATYVQMRIDRDANGVWDDALFFEPVYQNGTYGLIPAYAVTPVPNQCGGNPNCVSLNTWQTWNAGIGGWWSNVDSAGGPPLTTIADYIAEFPTAVLATDVPAFRMQAGFGAPVWNNFDGNFDQLIVNGTTYNFEL